MATFGVRTKALSTRNHDLISAPQRGLGKTNTKTIEWNVVIVTKHLTINIII